MNSSDIPIPDELAAMEKAVEDEVHEGLQSIELEFLIRLSVEDDVDKARIQVGLSIDGVEQIVQKVQRLHLLYIDVKSKPFLVPHWKAQRERASP